MPSGNSPGSEKISRVIKSVGRKPTVVRCEECPRRIESQLDVRGNDFLGQSVGTDCAVESSVAMVRTPLDRKV